MDQTPASNVIQVYVSFRVQQAIEVKTVHDMKKHQIRESKKLLEVLKQGVEEDVVAKNSRKSLLIQLGSSKLL